MRQHSIDVARFQAAIQVSANIIIDSWVIRFGRRSTAQRAWPIAARGQQTSDL
jgi:hypothetical protein